ncbi:SatD family protein [Mumia quercus]|uniref:SatD family protein n=1 Tax=Mumia quercus TaxID=2976125 RepID=UPI0021D1D7CB|nr:SatD family protein [Mumia quercus]
MYVMTLDQRGSRRGNDAVPELLEDLATTVEPVRAFERTAGDEVQGLLDSPDDVVRVVVRALRDGRWWIGVGVGEVEGPLPATTRAGRGPAYVRARAAVERAKVEPQPVVVRAEEGELAEDAESALWLLASLLGRRSEAGWEAVDAMGHAGSPHPPTQREAASALGISAQAMSRRLAVAGWTEERRGRTLAARLLAASDPEQKASR